MVVLCGGSHIDKAEEERRARAGTYFEMREARLLKLEYPVSNRSDFETNSVANRKPMRIRENRCDAAEPRFLCHYPSKSVLDTLKASQI